MSMRMSRCAMAAMAIWPMPVDFRDISLRYI
jgi:hypothetical protein